MAIDVTTKARVKALRGWITTENDDLIDSLITSTSARLDAILGRHVESTARTEYYELPMFNRSLWLRGFPNVVITSVKYTNTGDWTATDAMDSSNYASAGDDGTLRFYTDMSLDRGEVQVVYTGGMAADTTDFIAAYPDVSFAVDEHVINIITRRMAPGGKTVFAGGSVGGMGGGEEHVGEVGDLRTLQEAVKAHRRFLA